MHVLIVPSEHFVTARYPVGGIFQYHQANALQRAGHQVGVIAPGVISPRFFLRGYPYPPIEQLHGYPVLRRYVRKPYPHRWISQRSAIKLYAGLGTESYRSYVERYGRPDVIHAHNVNYAGLIAQAISKSEDVPYVVTEHSSLFMTGAIGHNAAEAMAACARDASAMTAVSSALARAVANKLAIREVGILPNLVDPFIMNSPLVERRPDPAGAPMTTFLAIGSLDANKDHATLIGAFARNFTGKRAKLRIGGTGNLDADLRALARRLGVHEQVLFLGHLDRPAVRAEMQAASALVLSSLKETFGVVLIEALACGRPVITTRSGGPEDVVTESNGLTVEPGDPAALGEAMERMAATIFHYEPARIRADAAARFGEAVFVENATRYYLEATGGK
jgi:glycosyltransferase involved in cell wall biosynthesis